VWCIVVAGGSGRRFGTAKQFEALCGATVLERSVDVAACASDGVVVVVPEDSVTSVDLGGVSTRRGCQVAVVAGGPTRSASVRAGLAAVPDEARVVLVHDAARPLATVELFARVRDAVRSGAVAVVPAVPITDTVRRVDGGVVDRDGLRAVQTPQGFDAATLRAAHGGSPDATDDAGLVEQLGGTVTLVEGERHNLKITEPVDLRIAAALVDREGDPSS
jgi:2-C-methyl-D-erythritol 4-phosphate cytidylyltransferase